MRNSVFIILLFISVSIKSYGQINLVIEGVAYENAQDSWRGVDIERSEKTLLTFRNNSITSVNTSGYMLQAGDDSYLTTANNLDNSGITGNNFDWNGPGGNGLCHGIMAGYNINYTISHNRIEGPYYGIVHEGGYDDGLPMVNTTGGISYNIFSNTPTAVVVMGYDNPMIYNNTFFYGLSEYSAGIIRIRKSNGTEIPAPSQNVKIKNNIFYSVNQVAYIYVEEGLLTDFECDYNIYYCEESTDNEPLFMVADTTVSWDEWQALGYDTHSRILDPGFINTETFVPEYSLEYGVTLGEDYNTGLSTEVEWNLGEYPDLQEQNQVWQVGAIVHSVNNTNPSPLYISSVIKDNSPSVLEMTYSMTLANIVPSASAFTVVVNSVQRNVISVAISGSQVLLTLSGPVVYGDLVRISYTRPSVNPLQNETGETAASITARTVANNCNPPVNNPPVISILSPTENSSFVAPAIITVTAEALDSDGTVKKVEYFKGSEKLGENLSAPYTFSFECEDTGTYELTAIATDNMDAVSSSDPVHIFVTPENVFSGFINLFPNPNDGRFSIKFSSSLQGKDNRVIIVNYEGKPVYEILLNEEETNREFDLSGLMSGTYIVVIISDNKILSTNIFLKK